ncbi:MAG: hypothetical protein AAFS10_09905 [Myxococcota bacterium]
MQHTQRWMDRGQWGLWGAMVVVGLTLAMPVWWVQAAPKAPKGLRFQVFQDGRLVPIVNNQVTLRRAPFTLKPRFTGSMAGRTPSLIASAGPGLRRQLEEVKTPLVAVTGFSAATLPHDVYLTTTPLELHVGWSAALAERWNGIYLPDQLKAYQTYEQQQPATPTVLMAGRQHACFTTDSKGQDTLHVRKLGGTPIASTTLDRMTFIVIAEHYVKGNAIGVTELAWRHLEVVFKP